MIVGNQFGAVVTSFNPPDSFYENMRAISTQVSSLVIVDNGSEEKYYRTLQGLARDYENIEIIYNGKNLGVATALNIGVRQLLKTPVRWIATFDHDTLIPNDYFSRLMNAAKNYKDFDGVRLIAPNGGDHDGGISEGGEEIVAITSGTLHKRDVFNEVGFFKDSLFIDCIDHEFCFRIKKFGYRLLVIYSVRTEHQLGYPIATSFLFLKYWTLNYPPMRYFYIYRNSVWLTRKYWRYSVRWFVSYWWALLKNLSKILLSETQKKSKLSAVFRGISAGLTKDF